MKDELLADELRRYREDSGFIIEPKSPDFPPLLVIGNVTLPPGDDGAGLVGGINPGVILFPPGVLVFQLIDGHWEPLNPPTPQCGSEGL